MVNFKTKSMGEKFTFSKDFILRLKVIKSLKPELTEPDAIRFVAHKFYGDDIVGVTEVVDFIEEQCGQGVNLTEAPLDGKKEEYLKSIQQESAEKQKNKKDKEKLVLEKEKELSKEKDNRKKCQEELEKSYKKVRNNSILFYSLLFGGLFLGVLTVMSFGGIAGTIYAAVGALSNISFTSLLSLGLLIGVGNYVWKQIKAKRKEKKDKKQTRHDKLNADYKAKEEALGKSKEKIETLNKELASVQKEAEAASKEATAQDLKKSAEEAHLSKYRTTTDFGRRVDFSAAFIRADFEKAKNKLEQSGASKQEKKNLTDWYNHYIGAIYYGATSGKITNVSELEAIEQEAREKFVLIQDPLNVVDMTYNNANVNSGTNNSTNRTLDDMYASL